MLFVKWGASMDDILKALLDAQEKLKNHENERLKKLCEENIFMVNSDFMKNKLIDMLPHEAQIIVCQSCEEDKIYVVKKWKSAFEPTEN